MANQTKGLVSIVWSGIPITGLAETAVSYDVGERGDTMSAADTVVHIQRNPNSVVSTVTVNVPKGTSNLNTILLAIQAGIPSPLTINDEGVGGRLFMASANPTQITIGDSTGGTDAEEYSFAFKGVLQILSLEG